VVLILLVIEQREVHAALEVLAGVKDVKEAPGMMPHEIY